MKDHKCESCEKSFTRAWSLKIHVRTFHEGVKDQKGDSRGKCFSRAESLLKKRNESNLNSVGCHICKEKVLVNDYTSHCKEIHGITCIIKKAEKNLFKQFNE